jgi:hypothetical protein
MGVAQASDYLENLIIDHLFRSRTWPKPAALYIALFTAAPSDAGGGTEVPTSTGYKRVSLNPNDVNWTATQTGTPSGPSTGNSGRTTNAIAITFPAPVNAAWGTVTHFAIFDALTGGNMLIWDVLSAPGVIRQGDNAAVFPAGGIGITVR